MLAPNKCTRIESLVDSKRRLSYEANDACRDLLQVDQLALLAGWLAGLRPTGLIDWPGPLWLARCLRWSRWLRATVAVFLPISVQRCLRFLRFIWAWMVYAKQHLIRVKCFYEPLYTNRSHTEIYTRHCIQKFIQNIIYWNIYENSVYWTLGKRSCRENYSWNRTEITEADRTGS